MLGLKKINKKVFSKLYHYYWRKLLRRWGMLAFSLVIVVFIGGMNFYVIRLLMGEGKTWQGILTDFFMTSVFQLLIMGMITTFLVQALVGLVVNFGFFQAPKKDNTDDLKVLLFTPNVNRETVILAKFALTLTIFWIISFFLITLPLFCYFLFTFSNISLPLKFLFLLLSGTVGTIQNFLLVVPSNFYFTENYSFIMNLFSVFFLFFLGGSFFLFYFLCRYFVFAMFLYLPFSLLIGWVFWSLYYQKFLKKDIN